MPDVKFFKTEQFMPDARYFKTEQFMPDVRYFKNYADPAKGTVF